MPESSKRPAVRLSDVAQRARCSAATVSRVLNAPETVNREARLRVEAAVRELGYTRNGAARALRSRRSLTIGTILPTLKQPVYADFIGGVQHALARQSYSLIVTASDYSPDRELLQARLLAERGIDGLVLIGHTRPPELYDFLKSQDLPYVTTYTFRPDIGHPVIGFDNFAAMATIVNHLFDLGHRDFAMLVGKRGVSDRVEERVRGAVATLESLGLALPAARIVDEAFTVEGGRKGLRRLIAAGQLPTALICSNDVLAHGVLFECRAQGIAVPADLSVVGFDDLQASAHVLPALTTLAIPSEEMGRRAGDYMLALCAGRDHPSQVPLGTHLVVRDTTAPPPAIRSRSGPMEGPR